MDGMSVVLLALECRVEVGKDFKIENARCGKWNELGGSGLAFAGLSVRVFTCHWEGWNILESSEDGTSQLRQVKTDHVDRYSALFSFLQFNTVKGTFTVVSTGVAAAAAMVPMTFTVLTEVHCQERGKPRSYTGEANALPSLLPQLKGLGPEKGGTGRSVPDVSEVPDDLVVVPTVFPGSEVKTQTTIRIKSSGKNLVSGVCGKAKDIITLIYWHLSNRIVQTTVTELDPKSEAGETRKCSLATRRHPGLHLRADFLKSNKTHDLENAFGKVATIESKNRLRAPSVLRLVLMAVTPELTSAVVLWKTCNGFCSRKEVHNDLLNESS
ncbi:hypothetical protein CB1_000998027 [Camelus ferus]|nr:hypothetical protein CB1_000998027 [Camelus ferus]